MKIFNETVYEMRSANTFSDQDTAKAKMSRLEKYAIRPRPHK